ncbi:MAG: hypothetical protein V1724_00475 [Chloroflexota bacterium]
MGLFCRERGAWQGSRQSPLGQGKVVYQFGAVDCFTRKRVVALAPRLTSAQGAAFLKRMVA